MPRIKEIFTSIQGEGPYVGYKQLFIRFCGCNLSCNYCDTDFLANDSSEYDAHKLIEICKNNQDCHSVSLTGGEPLLQSDFLKEFLPACPLPVYLETNATLPDELDKIIEYTDFISADIKIPSCSGCKPLWEIHDRFFSIASKKILFAKVVFDSKITQDEIEKICELCSKYSIELILQPRMDKDNITVSAEFIQKTLDKCLIYHKKTRLVAQTHKFIGVI